MASQPPIEVEVDDLVILNNTSSSKPKLTIGTDYETEQVFRIHSILPNGVARCSSAWSELQHLAGTNELVYTGRKIDTTVRSYHVRKLRKLFLTNIFHAFDFPKRATTNSGELEIWGVNLLTGKFVVKGTKASLAAKRVKTFYFREAQPQEILAIDY